MNTESQKIAIAEVVGWVRGPGGWRNGGEYITHPNEFPDYPNDLNAMHEAEKILRPEGAYGEWPLWDKYVKVLAWKLGEDDVSHATAKEKSECFLRTIGAWPL